MNYEDSLEWLYDLQYIGIKLGLANTKALLAELGDPHDKLKIIHVAGTNGKGSVCAFLTSVLVEAGHKVGTYTSPHLKEFGERIAINGYPMTHDELVRGIARIKPKVEELASRKNNKADCTFFETSTCMAFDHFARRKVDFAIMEVGMGGRLDSTNVAEPIISVITSIGLEHTEHLGNTLGEIAGEKAGIIKKGRPVVCGVEQKEALAIIQKKAKIMGARLVKPGNYNFEEQQVEIKLAGEHQLKNARVAITVLDELKKQGYDIEPDALKRGLENTRWPGRLQFARLQPTILLDAAHNPAGAESLAGFISTQLGDKKVTGIVGMINTKDPENYMKALEPVLDRVIVTAPEYEKALAPEELADFVSGKHEICRSVGDALDSTMREHGKNVIILVTGSIFTVSDAVAHLDQLRIREMMDLMGAHYPVGAFPGKEVGSNETTLGKRSGDTFDVLISTILSQRTRDENTHIASTALFERYTTPEELANADVSIVEELIRPAGFYKQKARKIIDTARALIEHHGSEVPEDMDELLALPGVGRKTANCVLVYGFNKPAMPVDTHVHRISNLIGLINTREADHSEFALIDLIPEEYWIDINRFMVRHGQVVCKPINPQCHKCFMSHICDTGIDRLGMSK